VSGARVPVGLFGELLDLVESVAGLHRDGRRPSLVPVSRLVQDIVEAMADHRPVLELLSVIRNPVEPMSPDRKWSAVAVHGLGLAIAAGLCRRDLLAVGVASILARVTEGLPPERAASALVHLDTLGDLAPQVLQSVHLLAGEGEPGDHDRVSRVLLVALAYVELTEGLGGRPCLAPAHALATLCSGRLARVDVRLARRMALARGGWPVGSLLRLANERLCVVVGWSEGEAHGRPVVVPLEPGGSLGRPIDLSEVHGLTILETVTARAACVDLSTMRPGEERPELPFSLGALRGPSVSLSYEIGDGEGEAGPFDDSLEFELSIDEESIELSMEAETLSKMLAPTIEF
jgi:hypothetical protein